MTRKRTNQTNMTPPEDFRQSYLPCRPLETMRENDSVVPTQEALVTPQAESGKITRLTHFFDKPMLVEDGLLSMSIAELSELSSRFQSSGATGSCSSQIGTPQGLRSKVFPHLGKLITSFGASNLAYHKPSGCTLPATTLVPEVNTGEWSNTGTVKTALPTSDSYRDDTFKDQSPTPARNTWAPFENEFFLVLTPTTAPFPKTLQTECSTISGWSPVQEYLNQLQTNRTQRRFSFDFGAESDSASIAKSYQSYKQALQWRRASGSDDAEGNRQQTGLIQVEFIADDEVLSLPEEGCACYLFASEDDTKPSIVVPYYTQRFFNRSPFESTSDCALGQLEVPWFSTCRKAFIPQESI